MNIPITLLTVLAMVTLASCTPSSYEQVAALQANLPGCQIERIAKRHNDDHEAVAWLVTNSQKQQFVVWFHVHSNNVFVKTMGLTFDQPAEQMVTDQAWQKILQLAEKPLVNQ